MRLIPKNKFLVVKPSVSEKPEQSSGFFLPEGHDKETFKLVEIVEVSADSVVYQEHHKGHLLLVPAHMVEEVDVNGHKLYFVSESAVYGMAI